MLDKFGRQYKQLITYNQALEKFEKYLAFYKAGATPVYEVRSIAINNRVGVRRVLNAVEKGSAVWQHTDKWHTAAICIQKGYGRKFSRQVLNLFKHGVTDKESFEKAWVKQNNAFDLGVFPRAPGSFTSQIRKQQTSYIVYDKNQGENKLSKITGSYEKNQVHRTHLISSQTTGIEKNKGLLIDYDGWLNSNPMNQFETKILDLSDDQDIVWTANVWRDRNNDLHFKYVMYDKNYHKIAEKEWIDDRWTYLWYFDNGQDELTKRI